jgi:hypothetical protein
VVSKKLKCFNGYFTIYKNLLTNSYLLLHSVPELTFTELILQSLYWIYAIAIHNRIFILDLPTNKDLCKLLLFIFGRKLGCF